MEQKLQNDEAFESLWQRAEESRYVARLRRDYPAWLRRRRQRRWTAVAMAACAAVAVVVWPVQGQSKGYDRVYCNRTVQPDSHWASLAGKMLTEEMS